MSEPDYITPAALDRLKSGPVTHQFPDLYLHRFTKVYADDDELRFVRSDGRTFMFYHSQDCCESVSIESIVGALNDLVGVPLLLVDESTQESDPALHESGTWTFYKFATIKGYVDVRWLGTSNGYYSESVNFKEVK